jgi:hypothetical protein
MHLIFRWNVLPNAEHDRSHSRLPVYLSRWVNQDLSLADHPRGGCDPGNYASVAHQLGLRFCLPQNGYTAYRDNKDGQQKEQHGGSTAQAREK